MFDARTPVARRLRIARLVAALLVATAPVSAAAGEPLRIDYTEAVRIALERNLALRGAGNDLELARAAVSDARMRFLPDLRASVSGSRSWSGSPSGAGESTTSTSWSGGLASGVVLFDGFANVAGLREAELEERAGGEDLERSRQTVVFGVITGYLALIEATEQLRVREENLTAQAEQEEYVRALVEEGKRPASEFYQQQSGVAAARLAVVEARRSRDLARVGLVRVLSLDPAAEYEFALPELEEPDRAGSAEDPGGLIAAAFSSRPDLLGAADRLHAAGQRERAAAAERWPTVSLSAGVGTSYSPDREGAFVDQVDDGTSGSLGISMSYPVFDRLAIRNDIARSRISTSNADLALESLRQEVAVQVRTALLDREAARERLLAYDAQVRAAGEALSLTEERYRAGAATLVEVTLVRADLVSAESGRVGARYNLLWQDRLLAYYVGSLDPDDGLAGVGS